MPSNHSGLRPVHQGLFPTLDSLQSAVDLAMSQLPITTEHQMKSILMTFQNTLIKQLQQDTHV